MSKKEVVKLPLKVGYKTNYYSPLQPELPLQPLQPEQPLQPLQPEQPLQPLQPEQPEAAGVAASAA